MSLISVNTILEWIAELDQPPLSERVLWIEPGGEAVFVISIFNPKSLPIMRLRSEIEEALQQEHAIRRTVDPYASLATMHIDAPARHLEIRDRVWKRIEALVAQQPDIYLEEKRKRLILNDPEASKGSINKIYDYLRKYWKRGMIKNALLPDYGNCGAPGKSRGIKDDRKRGRKPKVLAVAPEQIGVNVDEDIKRIFSIAFKRYYDSREDNPLRRAYNKMIENHFNLGYRRQGELQIPIPPPAHLVPTLAQFSYWYKRQNNLIHSIVAREGRRAYVLKHRPLLGNSTSMAFGPGSIYQIDATVADIYLVWSLDRSRIIGRPVVYLCIDVLSRLCVGLHVALEGPSWLTGMMALANSTIDKVSFCAEYGIDISQEEWPCAHLPEQILADRGEFIGIMSDCLVDSLNITFANCPPYRGDLKGIVERAFRRSNDTFIKWMPGAVRKREPGDADYRLDATLTLHEFTKVLILTVIEYNLYHRMNKYPIDRDMMVDGVEPIPIDLWNWGIANRTGHLREKSPDAIKLSLLPRDKASVTAQGIQFKGMFYSCELAIQEQWFVRARKSGRWSMTASYDPRKPEVIYLHQGGGKLESCQLLPKDERFSNLPIEEILEYQEIQKQKAVLYEPRRMESSGELNTMIDHVVDGAYEQTKAAKSNPESSRSQLKHIRKNRAEANEQLRDEQAWDLRPQSKQQTSQDPHDDNDGLPLNEKSNVISLATSKKKSFLEVIKQSEHGEGDE